MDSTPTHNARNSWRRGMSAVRDRLTAFPPWVVVTQLFLGFGWSRAVAEKMIDSRWWTGAVIDDFIDAHQEMTLGWYGPFVDAIVLPGVIAIALIVVVGQLVAALSLISGRHLGAGLTVGMFLNLNFLAVGAVSPSVFYLVLQGVLALWLVEQTPTGSLNQLRLVAAIAAAMAAASAKFVSTLHPDAVIDDPALIFVFGGALATLACVLAMQAHKKTEAADHAAKLNETPVRQVSLGGQPVMTSPGPGAGMERSVSGPNR